jgi:polyisoprenoid-binding protein YceI
MTRFSVVTHRSRVEVVVKVTLQRFHLKSEQVRGAFDADVDEQGAIRSPEMSGRMKVRSDSLKSGNRLFDRDMNKMLETRKYSEITGEILGAEPNGDGDYAIRGRLYLHGMSEDVTGVARVIEAGPDHALFEGKMTIDFTHFNLDPPKLLVLKVIPELEVTGTIYAERQK